MSIWIHSLHHEEESDKEEGVEERKGFTFLYKWTFFCTKLNQLTPLSGKLEPLLECTPNVGAPLSDIKSTIELWSIPFVRKAETTSPTDWSNFDTIAANKK